MEFDYWESGENTLGFIMQFITDAYERRARYKQTKTANKEDTF